MARGVGAVGMILEDLDRPRLIALEQRLDGGLGDARGDHRGIRHADDRRGLPASRQGCSDAGEEFHRPEVIHRDDLGIGSVVEVDAAHHGLDRPGAVFQEPLDRVLPGSGRCEVHLDVSPLARQVEPEDAFPRGFELFADRQAEPGL